MKKFAFDSSGAAQAARPPISLHPAFRAIVAAWLALLLGAGSLILPGGMVERALDAIGLAGLVPSPTAPIGPVARGLIALVAAAAGGAAGGVIAWFVSRAQADAKREPESDFASRARRPLNVYEELGGESPVDGFGWPDDPHRSSAPVEDDEAQGGYGRAPFAKPEKEAKSALAENSPSLPETFESEATGSYADPAPSLSPPATSSGETPKSAAPDTEPLYFSPPSLSRQAAAAMQMASSAPGVAPILAAESNMIAVSHGRRQRMTAIVRPRMPPSNQLETEVALRDALATLRRASGAS